MKITLSIDITKHGKSGAHKRVPDFLAFMDQFIQKSNIYAHLVDERKKQAISLLENIGAK